MRSAISGHTSRLSTSASAAPSATPTSSSGFSSEKYEAAKATALKDLVANDRNNSGNQAFGNDYDDVKTDLKRCLFQRANFEDVLHADEMWKKSRLDVAKYAVTNDDAHMSLYVGARP